MLKYLPVSVFFIHFTAIAPNLIAEPAYSFSANVSLTNDYKYYGATQSNEGWAVQGGFDFNHASGFYLGTWASTIDFAGCSGNVSCDAAQIELNFYGGYAGELINGISYDAGLYYYVYPDQNEELFTDGGGDFDYYEVFALVGYTFEAMPLKPGIGAGIYYSPDWFGEAGDSIYVPVKLDVSLPQGFGLYVNYGYFSLENDNFDYSHYQVGVTNSLAGFDFDLGWADAESECGGDQLCEGLVFSISRSF